MPPIVNLDIMTLNYGHSMMLPNVVKNDPQKISDHFFDNRKEDNIASFGLFGGSNNYCNYYPEASNDDFNPSEDEFIEPMYRLLSNCIVAKSTMPTEFPANVLKESMPLLIGCTVNCDHGTDIANAIGSIKSVVWQDSYKIGNRVIPAGINGVLRIDAKSNPRIARGINMDPPSIHSNSVTVKFEWKPSHKFEKQWEFWDKLGTIAEDGQMVRRIATKIIAYMETSLVWQGADPFAKLIKDGKIVNSTYASSVYNGMFSEKKPEEIIEDIKKRVHMDDFKMVSEDGTNMSTMMNSEGTINHNTTHSNNEGHNIPKNHNNMNELAKFLEQLFGQGCLTLNEGETPSIEIALSQVQNLVSENQRLSEANAQADETIVSLKSEIEERDKTIKLNELMVNIGKNRLTEVRDNTLASYNKLMGDKVDENIISLINAETTSLETLLSLKKTYDDQLEAKFPLHCAKCGSKDLSRNSSVKEDEEDEEDSAKENFSEENIHDSIKNIAKTKLK